MNTLIERLRAQGVTDLVVDAPLAEHTSYRVGGPAAALVRPVSVDQVATTVRLANQAGAAWAPLGWGSNMIVADTGFDGVVIKLGDAFRYVRVPDLSDVAEGQAVPVVVGAATMNGHLVRDLHRAGLSGAEFLALIPGTFGGAVAMNAGTKAGEAQDVVRRVTLVDATGQIRDLDAAGLAFRYRHAELPPGSIVVEGTIGVVRGAVEKGREGVRSEREYRNRTQPYTLPSAGSVFKNPPGDHAGRLIEAAGMKGRRCGGARISDLHANFIVTTQGARADDVLWLMAAARAAVAERFGITLQPEQRVLGFGELELGHLLDQLAVQPPPDQAQGEQPEEGP